MSDEREGDEVGPVRRLDHSSRVRMIVITGGRGLHLLHRKHQKYPESVLASR